MAPPAAKAVSFYDIFHQYPAEWEWGIFSFSIYEVIIPITEHACIGGVCRPMALKIGIVLSLEANIMILHAKRIE
jgi:hypothetical protein